MAYPLCRLSQETAKGPVGLRVKLPPVYLSTAPGGGFELSLCIAERLARKLYLTIFMFFGLTRPKIEPKSTVSVADALSIRPLINHCLLFCRGGFRACSEMLQALQWIRSADGFRWTCVRLRRHQCQN